MAFPDWPTSAGHLVNPPGWWEAANTRWEHGHRLLGWLVGMLSIVLAILSWPRRGMVRAVGLSTLLAIGVQGVLGGLRVTEVSTLFAMVHGIWGQLCFCLAATAALVTSLTWTNARGSVEVQAATFLQRLCIVGTAVVFLQVVSGAALRHFGGDHALVTHILWAVVVTLLAGWLAMGILGLPPQCRLLVRLGRAFAVLIVLQLLLGGSSFLITVVSLSAPGPLQWVVPSAHVAAGALLLANSLLLALSTYHVLRPAELSDETVPATSLASSS